MLNFRGVCPKNPGFPSSNRILGMGLRPPIEGNGLDSWGVLLEKEMREMELNELEGQEKIATNSQFTGISRVYMIYRSLIL